MLAAAAHAENPTLHAPPPELALAWHCQKWNALPSAGGLRDQPAGLIARITTAANVYDAFRGMLAASSWAEWSRDHPGEYAIVERVQKLRRENGTA